MSASGLDRRSFDRQIDGGREFFEHPFSGPKCAEGCVAGSYVDARKPEGWIVVLTLGRPGELTACLLFQLVLFGFTHEQYGFRRYRKLRIRKPGSGLQFAADMDELALVRWINPVRIALDYQSAPSSSERAMLTACLSVWNKCIVAKITNKRPNAVFVRLGRRIQLSGKGKVILTAFDSAARALSACSLARRNVR